MGVARPGYRRHQRQLTTFAAQPEPPAWLNRRGFGSVRGETITVSVVARTVADMTNHTAPRLVTATDGSAKPNPGPTGWAWAASAPDGGVPRVWAAGALPHGTNNIGELMALQQLLTVCPAHVLLEVRMDSQYALNAVSKWIHGWRRNRWVNAKGQPVANQDLIRDIDQLMAGRDITFTWVKAHQRRGLGDPLNEFVDQAAQAASDAMRAGRPIPGGPGWPAH